MSLKLSRQYLIAAGFLSIMATACTTMSPSADQPVRQAVTPAKIDKFTYANYDQVAMTHLALDLDVDFDRKVLDGTAVIDFKRLDPAAMALVLDSKDLTIKRVETRQAGQWSEGRYTLGADDPALGASLSIDIPADVDQVRITYETSPGAEGLQWLDPVQTAGKQYPYLFSQAQAINARTMAPVQDTPGIRITYSATLRTPPELIALMSAEQDPNTPRDGEYHFNMPQPIPPYLLAIAVGDIDFKPINDHIGVYAEPYILDQAVWEFAETPKMETANAALYGPYRWGRYDMIVLPPSFPFGGMENPRLSFLTPTLVAGDRSLTNVVAHELAHSWSGNLVTNASWRDGWLNEGFTSYVENRVMEALYGKDRAIMEQALDMQSLKAVIADISHEKRPELTQLKMPDDIETTDETFTNVAYIKGANFLFFLEDRFGRDHFDPFLKNYFDHYAFQSVTTEDFLRFLNENLRQAFPDAVTDAEIKAWVYEPGLPDTARQVTSDAFEAVDGQRRAWEAGIFTVTDIQTAQWSTHEWLHFLNGLSSNLTKGQLTELDRAFQLSGADNAEIAFAWYMKTIPAGYAPAKTGLEDFLMTIGRGKFIYRLYGALVDNDQADWAQRVYGAARAGYHPIAQRRIDDLLDWDDQN